MVNTKKRIPTQFYPWKSTQPMNIYPVLIHNGDFIDPAAATLPIYTPALVGALGVYETILALNGRYIDLDEHLQRLQASARGAELNLAVSLTTVRDWCYRLLAANAPEGHVRLLALDVGNPTADIFLYQKPYIPLPAEAYTEGVSVIIYHGERALPQIKSFNTLVPGLARKAALAAGAHDALLVDRDGNITEGSNCNVFAVIAGVLVAPPPGVVLEGTVMARTLTLAAELGIPVQRRPLPLSEMPQWQEAFLTSTSRRILPIRRVGEHSLGSIGPITRRLLDAYRQWEAAALSDYSPHNQ